MGNELPAACQDLGRTVIRKANHKDVVWISEHMRRDDIREVMAFGKTPYESLRQGLINSVRCITVEFDGTPVLMAGIVDDMDAPGIFGNIWMLATDGLSKIRKTFVRHGHDVVDYLGQGYQHIGNGVAAFNKKHIRWLCWMGFRFYNKFLVGDVPFYSFGMMMTHV